MARPRRASSTTPVTRGVVSAEPSPAGPAMYDWWVKLTCGHSRNVKTHSDPPSRVECRECAGYTKPCVDGSQSAAVHSAATSKLRRRS